MTTSNENIRILRPFLRGLPIVVLIVAICVLAAKRYLKYAVPMYESTAKIRLADTKEGSPSANLFKDFDVFANANKIGAELEVIKSRVLINNALDSLKFDVSTFRVGKIRKMEMYNEAPFIVHYKLKSHYLFDKVVELSILTKDRCTLKMPNGAVVSGSFGKPIAVKGDTLLIEKNETLIKTKPNVKLEDNYEFIINSRQKLIEDIQANMDISSIDKEIPVIRINYKSAVPLKAADFVNSLSKAYVDDYIQNKYLSANTTVNFLDNQLKEISEKLESSENDIKDYRDSTGIINIRQETETDLRKIADMKVQQTNVKMNLDAIKDLYKYMVSGHDKPLELAPNFEAYTDLLATEMVKKLKLLQAEKKDALLKYTPEHDVIKNIDLKIKDVTHYLEEAIKNTRDNLQVKYDRLTYDIAKAESVFIGLPDREKTLGGLNREFNLNEQAYLFLQNKKTDAQIARAATISFHRIITPGEVPMLPVSPNRTLITVLAAFLGFLGSVLIIYVVHGIKGKVNDKQTIEKNSSIPIAAALPFLKNGQINRYFHKTAIQLYTKEMLPDHGIITLSSFSKMEGKRFIATHLATELVKQGKKVLFVDVDGTVDTLPRGIDVVNIAVENGKFYNAEFADSQFSQWKTNYDIIIIKNENIELATMGYLFMRMADINLFVVDTRRTNAKKIQEAEILKDEYQFPAMNFILNREFYNPNIIFQVIHIIKNFPYRKPTWTKIAELLA